MPVVIFLGVLLGLGLKKKRAKKNKKTGILSGSIGVRVGGCTDRLRVVSNFGDSNRGAGENKLNKHTRALECEIRHVTRSQYCTDPFLAWVLACLHVRYLLKAGAVI